MATSASFAPVAISDDEHHQTRQNVGVVPTTATMASVTTYTKSYRGGFHSSVCDLFQDPYDRSSCCALMCCGTFLYDKNNYIVTGEMPPPWWIRVLMFVGGLVVCLVLSALFTGGLFLGTVGFLAAVGARGMFQRMRLRQLIVDRMRSSSNSNSSEETADNAAVLLRNNNHIDDGCWCCLRNDVIYHQTLTSSSSSASNREYVGTSDVSSTRDDFCSVLWRALADAFFGACCGVWCNVCGMCAVGQEARELRHIFSVEQFRIDYITMQPYADYFPSIERLRIQRNGSFMDHIQALSMLSTKLVRIFSAVLLLLLAASIFHAVQGFSFSKMIVVALTLGQAFGILYLFHWRNHRFDLSLDAVVKMFASGFVLAVLTAFTIELVVDTLIKIVFFMLFVFDVIEDNPNWDPDQSSPSDTVDVIKHTAQKHLWVVILYFFFQAFLCASSIEEFTKYFCFWMVEHPDLDYDDANAIDATTPASALEQQALTAIDIDEAPAGNDSRSAESQDRGIHSRAAAITIAMVATAVGFACHENFIYVFGGIQGQSLSGEITVLLLRSAMPVHPLCAAIQSIGIIRRDVEKDPSFQLGRALLPAIFLHGLFDFVLMALAAIRLVESPDNDTTNAFDPASVEPEEQKLKIPILDTFLAFIIVVLGAIYYAWEARKQQNRLNALESSSSASSSGDNEQDKSLAHFEMT